MSRDVATFAKRKLRPLQPQSGGTYDQMANDQGATSVVQ